RGWPRSGIFGRLRAGVLLIFALIRCGLYVLRYRPDIVIGVGGFVSLPALLAAQFLGYRTIVHEQNKRLGLANRMAARRANALLMSYPETQGPYPRERARLTGNP